MLARRSRWTCAAAAVAVLATGGLAEAGPQPATAPAAQRAVTGVPAGGPPVLYAQPPDVPELQNRDGRFRAPYELSSGTERYVDGEYLYTDYLYDDGDTTYPDDFDRYGGNAADLVEYRMSVRDAGLAVRLSLTTLLATDSTIAVVAFDSDRDASTGSSTLPRDPGLPFPGTDAVLTTWGTGAEWSTWDGAAWQSVPLRASADLEANQITVTVPAQVARPTGKWSATLATGLYDRAAGGWLPSQKLGGSTIVNLGFRFDGRDPGASPTRGQTVALTTRTPTTYAHDLDFDLLSSRGRRDNVPTHGLVYRMFASRLASVDYVRETSPGVFEKFPAGEGKQMGPSGAQYLSRLQPYALHVPTGYDASRPAPLTLSMHGQDGDYHALAQSHAAQQLGEDRGSIVLSPSGRGQRGWYIDESEHDVFEAWNDAARHYALDPLRTAVTGLSMGGYGAYRLGLRYPHLFSRILTTIPAMQLTQSVNGNSGIWVPGVNDNETLVNRWVDNARNLPVFHIADAASESTFYPAQYTHVAGPPVNGSRSLDSLGYRYRLWSVAADHALLVVLTNFPEATEFLNRHTIEPEPFHITYTRTPVSDRHDLGLAPDLAYWVSGIEVRDATTAGPSAVPGGPPAAPAGRIDVVSLGFGKSDPPSSVARDAGTTADGLAYVEQERTWDEPVAVPRENRLVINATNVRSLAIDPVAARVDCDAQLDVTSDGPIEVRLLGCPKPAAAAIATAGTQPLLALPLVGGGFLIARARRGSANSTRKPA